MAIEAIKDDGIYSTFKFDNDWLPTMKLTKITLCYCKFDGDGCSWMPKRKKILYKTCPELGDARYLYDRIKLDMVKNDNAIWSTIKVQPCYDHFDVSYEKVLHTTEDPHLTTSRYLGASDLEIENTKKTLQRLEKNDINKSLTELQNKIYEQLGLTESLMNKLDTAEGLQKCWEKKEKEIADAGIPLRQYFPPLERLRENTWYGLYPRYSGLTCHFDEKLKEDIKASLEGKWKPKAIPWCGYSPVNAMNDEVVKYIVEADVKATKEAFEFKNGYYLKSNKKEKEKTDMNVTLMVVPNGMNKDFVKKVKASFQSNNSQRLFVASTDIDYSCEYEPIKTKYDLFEHWIKTGKVDIVHFMIGFEKDPDTRAFESFVRGIIEAEVPGKVDIRIYYQQDDILNDMNSLRTLYFDEADAKEDLENAGNKVFKETNTMRDIYSLDDEGLEAIKYSKGRIDASEEFVMGKIMEAAFASDEDAKPAKKGGKK